MDWERPTRPNTRFEAVCVQQLRAYSRLSEVGFAGADVGALVALLPELGPPPRSPPPFGLGSCLHEEFTDRRSSANEWKKGESDALWSAGELGTLTVYYPEKLIAPAVTGRALSRAIRPEVILSYYAQKHSRTGKLSRTRSRNTRGSARSGRLSGTTNTKTSSGAYSSFTPQSSDSSCLPSAQLTRSATKHFPPQLDTQSSSYASMNAQCTDHFTRDDSQETRNCSSVTFYDGSARYRDERQSLYEGSHVQSVEERAYTPFDRGSEDNGSRLVGGEYDCSCPKQDDDEDSLFGDSCVHSVEETATSPSTRVSDRDGYDHLVQYQDCGPRPEQYEGQDSLFGDSYGRPFGDPANPLASRSSEDDGLSLVGHKHDYALPEPYHGHGHGPSLVENRYSYSSPEQYQHDEPSFVGYNHSYVSEQYQHDGCRLVGGSYGYPLPVQYQNGGRRLVGDNRGYVSEQYQDGGRRHVGNRRRYLVPEKYQNDGCTLAEGHYNYAVTKQYPQDDHSLVGDSYVDHFEKLPTSPTTDVSEQYTTPEVHRSHMPYPRPQYDTQNRSYTGQLGINPSYIVNSAYNVTEVAYPMSNPTQGDAH
ncbi:hypothetical protein K466DRAFT_605786 [Polyporus arcularius HHB13444]|uniref:Uncharacterized protein n=1 Tax=Polyporus arcularius HHB13444 TaxID=1314778 RepID=A0A5C3NSA2_9APHY|nr:hypothetical protein K466DRAFT_605786 [Polyporus arcularius HHB13444]